MEEQNLVKQMHVLTERESMLGREIYKEYDALLERCPQLIDTASRIQTDNDDDEFVRICIAGFLENASVDDWGRDTYKFISDARVGEFAESRLREFFGNDWRAFGLFHCLFVGYNLGLLASARIDGDQFKAYELSVYPFRDGHREEIVDLFA